VINEN